MECLFDASGNLGSDISTSALIFSPLFFIVYRYSAPLDGALGAKKLYFVFPAVLSLFVLLVFERVTIFAHIFLK